VTAVDRADLLLANIHLSQHYDCLTVCFLFSLEILSRLEIIINYQIFAKTITFLLKVTWFSRFGFYCFVFQGTEVMPNATQRGFEGFTDLNHRNKVLGGTE